MIAKNRLFTAAIASLFIIMNTMHARVIAPSEHGSVLSFIRELDNLSHQTTNTTRIRNVPQKAKWTFIVYIAADNDLRNFSIRNIKQMASIGSNDNVNIVVQIDIRLTRENKITRRYYIEKDRITHVNANDPHSQRMDSGDSKTLVSCCNWAIHNYPAEEYALILWDHGTGCLDPYHGRVISPLELFTFNPSINKLELDRTIGYLDRINKYVDQRGICWDDSTGNYLTNQKLVAALHEICTKALQGKKLSIIGFDACLMSMLEIGSMIKEYAHIMIGSQEVELGTGWDYACVLAPLAQQPLDRFAFAHHIVNMYEATYHNITNDYTQSAIDLDKLEGLEQNVDSLAQMLLKFLKKQKGNSVKNALKLCVARSMCTHFDEPTFKDLDDLYHNIQSNINHFILNDEETRTSTQQLYDILTQGRTLISTCVFANRVGKNLGKARGISIYFPEKKLHASYLETTFAKQNAWKSLLETYLKL